MSYLQRNKFKKTKKLGWGKALSMTLLLSVFVLGAEFTREKFQIGNKTPNLTDELIQKSVLEDMNAIENKFAKERDGYKKNINEVTWSRNQLLAENEKLTSVISRGDERKTSPILDYSKLKCPRYLVELMEYMSAKHGFPSIATVYCIAAYESKFDPTCHTVTKKEDSRGLLQVNVMAHYERIPNKTKLFDPAYNLDFQLPELKVYYDKGKAKGLSGADLIIYTSRWGQRPSWDEWIAESIRKSYKEYLSSVIKE